MNLATTPIRIVALDDVRWDRDGLSEDLSNLPDIEIIEITGDARRFIELIEIEHPDVAITDLRIQNDYNAGLRILSEIKFRFPSTCCLVLTVYPELARFVEALDRGADAFISKQAYNEGKYSLPDVIRAMKRGARVYEGNLVLEMRQLLDLSRNPLTGPDVRHGVSLSPRQREVLSLVADGMSNQQIAERLIVAENTVKAHMADILHELTADDRRHAVRIARLNNLL